MTLDAKVTLLLDCIFIGGGVFNAAACKTTFFKVIGAGYVVYFTYALALDLLKVAHG